MFLILDTSYSCQLYGKFTICMHPRMTRDLLRCVFGCLCNSQKVWPEMLPSNVSQSGLEVVSGMLVGPEILTGSSFQKCTSRDKSNQLSVEWCFIKNAHLPKIMDQHIEQLIERLTHLGSQGTVSGWAALLERDIDSVYFGSKHLAIGETDPGNFSFKQPHWFSLDCVVF